MIQSYLSFIITFHESIFRFLYIIHPLRIKGFPLSGVQLVREFSVLFGVDTSLCMHGEGQASLPFLRSGPPSCWRQHFSLAWAHHQSVGAAVSASWGREYLPSLWTFLLWVRRTKSWAPMFMLQVLYLTCFLSGALEHFLSLYRGSHLCMVWMNSVQFPFKSSWRYPDRGKAQAIWNLSYRWSISMFHLVPQHLTWCSLLMKIQRGRLYSFYIEEWRCSTCISSCVGKC